MSKKRKKKRKQTACLQSSTSSAYLLWHPGDVQDGVLFRIRMLIFTDMTAGQVEKETVF